MALFKGSLATLVSGKIGGYVFQRNMRIRPYRLPLNPRTTLQDVVRAAFIAAAALWNNCDQAQQDAWTTYGQTHPKTNRIGDSIVLTGKQSLVSLNVPRFQVGLTGLNTAPGETPLNITPVGAGPQGAIDAGDIILTVTGMSLTAMLSMAVYVGKPRSPSSVRGRKALVYAGSIAGNATPVTTGTVNVPTGNAVAGDVYDVTFITRDQAEFTFATQYDTVVAA